MLSSWPVQFSLLALLLSAVSGTAKIRDTLYGTSVVAELPGTLYGEALYLKEGVSISFANLPLYSTEASNLPWNFSSYSSEDQANINAAHTLAFKFNTKGMKSPLLVANFTGIKVFTQFHIGTNGQLCNSSYYCNTFSFGSDPNLFECNFTYTSTIDDNINRTDDLVIFRLQYQDAAGQNNNNIDVPDYAWNATVTNIAPVSYPAIEFGAADLNTYHDDQVQKTFVPIVVVDKLKDKLNW